MTSERDPHSGLRAIRIHLWCNTALSGLIVIGLLFGRVALLAGLGVVAGLVALAGALYYGFQAASDAVARADENRGQQKD